MASVGLGVAACAPAEPDPTATVIVNARVIDGSGGPSRDVNVRIDADRIAAVGDFEPSAEHAVIDADGLVLAPGFIDVHSHHDEKLFELPEALAAVSQGITTIVAGQDGSQQYPLAELFASLESSPVAGNVASYAGHGTLRSEVMGEDYKRHTTPEEVAKMADLLRAELEAGALGLSSGLEYDPGSFSATEEVVELAQAAAAHGGRYISHIRSEDQYFWEAVEEIIRIGRKARMPVQVTHVKLAMNRWWGQAVRLTTRLDEARASGVEITADIYPYRAWSTSFTWLTTVIDVRDPQVPSLGIEKVWVNGELVSTAARPPATGRVGRFAGPVREADDYQQRTTTHRTAGPSLPGPTARTRRPDGRRTRERRLRRGPSATS